MTAALMTPLPHSPLAAASVVLLSLAANAQFSLAKPLSPSAPGTQSVLSRATSGSFLGGGSDCASPTILPPGPTVVPIPFDTTTPAAGPPTNPLEGLCTFFGKTRIEDEQWYLWTATSSGVARLSTCGGLAAVDSKIAIYPDDCANISLRAPLACKDDTPGCANLSTILSWDIVASESYLIQLGNSQLGVGGSSDFSIEELPARPAGQLDLGLTHNALGLVSGGEIMWLQTFEAGAGQLVTAIETAFGTPGTFAPHDGQPCTALVYAGSPDGTLTLLASESGVTSQTATDALVSFPFATPPFVSGTYTVAMVAQSGAAASIAPLDQSVNSKGRAWVAGEPLGVMDLANPANASSPPLELQSIQPGSFDGVFVMRVQTVGSGIEFVEGCNGDGGDGLGCTDCPCSNNTVPGTVGGCLNTFGLSARLHGSGTDSVAGGDLRFEATNAPPSGFTVLVSGSTLAPNGPANPCFGLGSGVRSAYLDGLRCAVGLVQRHGGRASAPDGSVGVTTPGWGPPNGPGLNSGGIAGHGGFVPGQTRHFQVFYRDLLGAACNTGLNTTQAVSLTFTP